MQGVGVVFIFEVLFWYGLFLKSSLNILQYCFCFILFFGRETCRILVPQPGIEPVHWVGRWSPSHWITREVPVIFVVLVVVWEVECPLRNDMWTAVREAGLGRGRRWVCMLQHQASAEPTVAGQQCRVVSSKTRCGLASPVTSHCMLAAPETGRTLGEAAPSPSLSLRRGLSCEPPAANTSVAGSFSNPPRGGEPRSKFKI